MKLGDGLELTFVRGDPARQSFFGAWRPGETGGLLRPDSTDVQLVLPGPRGNPERRWVAVDRLMLPDAIEALVDLGPTQQQVTPSARAAAVAVRWALDLIGRGRLLPWISPRGIDTWRVDPLDQQDTDYLQALAAELPPFLHCTPGPDSPDGSLTVMDPSFMLRSLLDAVGDCMVRTSAASVLTSSPVFSDLSSVPAPQLRPWVNDVAAPHCSGAALALTVLAPGLAEFDPEDAHAFGRSAVEPEHDWLVVLQLRSSSDPSLVVDAAQLWESPSEVLARLGDQAEADLLTGLKRAAAVAPILSPALRQAAPTQLELSVSDVGELMDSLDQLSQAGIDVRWPAELLTDPIERQLVASANAPGGGLPSLTDFDSLIAVNWEFLLEGSALTPEEFEALSNAKRPLVPIRGRWIRLDAKARHRLLAPPPAIAARDAVASALGVGFVIPTPESESLDGAPPEEDAEIVDVRVEGDLVKLIDHLSDLAGEREAAEPEGFMAELRPYQRRGLAWMSDLCDAKMGGCLADDMGLGKTVQILALHALRGGPSLVVCPTSVLANWEREAARFVPDATVHRYHGSNRQLPQLSGGSIVLTTYGVVRSDAEQLAQISWDVVVADEAQAMKNPRSRTARAMREIPAPTRLALTGTPVENRLVELWSIMDWAFPGLLGPMQKFRTTLALPIERDNNLMASQRLTAMITPFLLRRKKSDPAIAPELPPKTERDVIVPLTDEQVTLYSATTKEALASVQENDGLIRAGLVLKMLTALKQITNHPAHYLGESGPLTNRSGKLAALDDLMEAALAQNESTLVFSQYVAMGRLLEQHLTDRGIQCGFLHGGLSIKQRAELVDSFQARETPVLLLSLKAGGTGLNLTAATQVVHYDRWWNPAVEDQATDRAYRIGQDLPVTVHRLITEGTVEDRVALLLEQKRALADQVVGSGESWIGNLSNAELGELVQLANADAQIPVGTV